MSAQLSTTRAIAYVSRAVAGLTREDLDRLLVDARAHNKLHGVTGVLLFDGTRFLQYFEGTAQAVERIYARILASYMHTELETLFDNQVPEPYFNQWHMGCSMTTSSTLQQLSTRLWKRESQALQVDQNCHVPPVIHELVEFWNQAHAGTGAR